jgi:hypothetical protein
VRKFFTIFVILILSFPLNAQRWKLTRYEAAVGVGFTNYFGDIGGTSPEKGNWLGLKDINLLTTRPALMVGARYKTTEVSAIKLNLITLMIGGSDKGGDNSYRKYHFNTFGLEHSLQYEYAIFKEDRRHTTYMTYNRNGLLSTYSNKGLYVFGGLGGISYYNIIKRDPGNYTPTIDKTRDGFHYTGVLLGGLMGKYIYSNVYAFSVEVGVRYVLSDYLDGFTTSKSKSNDIYYYTNFSFIYRIKTTRKGLPDLRRYY